MQVNRGLFLLLLLFPTVASAQQAYVTVCAKPCVAPDGTTQPAGTALARVMANPGWNPGANMVLVPDTGQNLYRVPAPAPTNISSYDFMLRFTPFEQQAIQTAAQSNWQIQLWMTMIASKHRLNVADPKITGGMQALVSAGLLTAARSAQILDLNQTSP